jgi:hypothetical protein
VLQVTHLVEQRRTQDCKATGKKSELVNKFRRILGEAVVQPSVSFAATLTVSGSKAATAGKADILAANPEKLRRAQLVISKVMISPDTKISNSTKQALKDLGIVKQY